MNYVSQWIDENADYCELKYILLNNSLYSRRKFGYGIRNAIVFGKNFSAEFFIEEKELERIKDEGYKFLINSKKFNFFLKEIEKSNNLMLKAVKNLLKVNFSKLSNFEFLKLTWSYGSCISDLFTNYTATEPNKVVKLEQELRTFLINKKIYDLTQAFIILTQPKVKFVFKKDHDLFNKTIKESANSGVKKELIKSALFNVKRISQKEKYSMIAKLRPPQKILHIINVLSRLTQERMKIRLIGMIGIYYREMLLKETLRRAKITQNIYRIYDDSEIYYLVQKGKKLSKKVLVERKKGFMKILKNSKITTLEGNKAVNYFKRITQSSAKMDELKGTISSKGYAVGRVMVLDYRKSQEHSAKMKKMKYGDIIITQMTRPNIMPACEKARAIITEEGGVLCHAAIISREFKIPCLIGITKATEIFHDGDYVEVDANLGIVKKITEKEYNNLRKIKRV